MDEIPQQIRRNAIGAIDCDFYRARAAEMRRQSIREALQAAVAWALKPADRPAERFAAVLERERPA